MGVELKYALKLVKRNERWELNLKVDENRRCMENLEEARLQVFVFLDFLKISTQKKAYVHNIKIGLKHLLGICGWVTNFVSFVRVGKHRCANVQMCFQ